MGKKRREKGFWLRILILIVMISLLVYLNYLFLREPEVRIYLVRYNAIDTELKVTLENQGNRTLNIKGTYKLYGPEGLLQEVGDLEPVELPPKEVITLIYDVRAVSYPKLEVKAQLFQVSKDNKEKRILSKTYDVVIES